MTELDKQEIKVASVRILEILSGLSLKETKKVIKRLKKDIASTYYCKLESDDFCELIQDIEVSKQQKA